MRPNIIFSLDGENRSNTKKFCTKYYDDIFSFSRHEEITQNGPRSIKRDLDEKATRHNFSRVLIIRVSEW